MTEPIDFNGRANPDLENQLSYLIRKEFYILYYKLRFIPVYLVVATLALAGLVQFTSDESLIILKVISLSMLAIAWLVLIGFGLSVLLRWYRRVRWKNEEIQYFFSRKRTYTKPCFIRFPILDLKTI